MSAIDVDPKTLEVGAAASAHAYEQAIVHIGEEIKARDPSNLDRADRLARAARARTPTRSSPRCGADGSVRLPVLTTREEIAEAYAFIRGAERPARGHRPHRDPRRLVPVPGQHLAAVAEGQRRSVNNRQTLGAVPVGRGPGHHRRARVAAGAARAARRARRGRRDRRRPAARARGRSSTSTRATSTALRANDVDAVLDVLHDGVASAVRDYVDDTGTLVELTGKDAHRAWYERVASTSTRSGRSSRSYQVTEDWYVFAELRITVAPRGGGRRRSRSTPRSSTCPRRTVGSSPASATARSRPDVSDPSRFPRAQVAIAGIGCTEFSQRLGRRRVHARRSGGQGRGRRRRARARATSTGSARSAPTTRSRRTSWRRRSASRA